jgi:hypothetical protein
VYDYGGRVRAWERRWWIRASWVRDPMGWPLRPQSRYREVADVAELHELVARARADPRVLSFRYGYEWILVGRPPGSCQQGHIYQAVLTHREDEMECGTCPGHRLHVCLRPVPDERRPRLCGDAQAEPPLGVDCTPVYRGVPWVPRTR